MFWTVGGGYFLQASCNRPMTGKNLLDFLKKPRAVRMRSEWDQILPNYRPHHEPFPAIFLQRAKICLKWANNQLEFFRSQELSGWDWNEIQTKAFSYNFPAKAFFRGDFRVIFTSIFLNFLNEDWYIKSRKPLVSLGFWGSVGMSRYFLSRSPVGW